MISKSPRTSSSVHTLETKSPNDAAVLWHEKYGSSEFDDSAPATPEEQKFRHSFWSGRRLQTFNALKSISPGERRLDAFVNCGNTMRLMVSADGRDLKIKCNKCHDRFCVACQVERAARIRENIAQLIDVNNPRFLTLTLRHSQTSLKDQIDRIYRSFSTLRRRDVWKNHVTGGAAFLEIKVGEKDGLWHVHLHCLITGSYFDQKTLSREWHAVTGDSSIVDIRAIKTSEDAARYVTKYVTKPADNSVFGCTDKLQEFIISLRGRRLCMTFGSWRGTKLEDRPKCDVEWHDIGSLTSIRTRAADGDADASRFLQAAARKWPLFAAIFTKPPPD